MKRWAMRITICLLLGLITTVAVAWTCAVWVHVGEGDLRQGWHDETDLQWMRGWRLSRRDAFGTHRLLAMARRTVPSPQKAPFPIVSRDELTPWWSSARQAMDDQVRTVRKEEARRQAEGDTTTVRPTVFYDDARGWPLAALWCRWDAGLVPGGPEDGKLLHGGIELEPVKPQRQGTRNADDQRALPLRPIWRGLAVDSLLYALIWFILVGGVGFVRREIRRVQGRCIKCGYDLRGAEHEVCPECGIAGGPTAVASG